MDPVTHAMAGLIIGSNGTGGLVLSSGALAASVLGAVMPDFDIVAQFWGDFAYLKQHRGFSHSLPGLALISLVTAGLLTGVYREMAFSHLMFWAFCGALSHSLLDLFNSYGVMVLWPFSRKKFALNLLMIFDPVLFIAGLLALFSVHSLYKAGLVVFLIVYLLLRLLMRFYAYRLVRKRLAPDHPSVRVAVLPSKRNLFKWDFIAYLPRKNVIGSVDLIRRDCRIIRRLSCPQKEMWKTLKETVLGQIFSEFTPYYHIDCRLVDDKWVGRFLDLRYCVKDRFLHSATLVMDRELNVVEAFFQPFSPARRIYLNESKS